MLLLVLKLFMKNIHLEGTWLFANVIHVTIIDRFSSSPIHIQVETKQIGMFSHWNMVKHD